MIRQHYHHDCVIVSWNRFSNRSAPKTVLMFCLEKSKGINTGSFVHVWAMKAQIELAPKRRIFNFFSPLNDGLHFILLPKS